MLVTRGADGEAGLPPVGPPPTTPPAPPKRRRWLRRILVAFLILVVLILLNPVIVIGTQPGTRFAVNQAMPFVNDLFQGDILIGRVEGTIGSRLVLHDVRIVDALGREAVAVRRLEAEVHLPALIDQRVELRDAILEGVTYTLASTDDHIIVADAFLPMEPSPEEIDPEPSAWVIDLQSIAIRDARFVSKEGLAPLVDSMSIALALHIQEGVLAWSRLAVHAAVHVRDVPISHVAITTDGSFAPEVLLLDSLSIKTPLASIDLQAHAFGLTPPPPKKPGDPSAPIQAEISLSGINIDLDAIGRWLKVPEISGVAHLEGAIRLDGDQAGLSLTSVTPHGRIDVRGTGDILKVTGLLAIDGTNLAPGTFLPTIPTLATDLTVRTRFEDLLAKAKKVDSRIQVSNVRGAPVSAEADLTTAVRGGAAMVTGLVTVGGQPIVLEASVPDIHAKGEWLADVRLRAAGFNLASLSGLVALPLGGQLRDLSLAATGRLAGGSPQSVQVALSVGIERPVLASAGGVVLGDGQIGLTADARWPIRGQKVPELTLDLDARLTSLVVDAARTGAVKLEVAAVPEAGATGVVVRLDVADVLAGPAGVGALHAEARGAATWSGVGMPKLIRLAAHVDADHVEAAGSSVQRVSVDVEGVPKDGLIRLDVPIKVSGISAPGPLTVGQVIGRLGVQVPGGTLDSLLLPGAFARPDVHVDLGVERVAMPETLAIPALSISGAGVVDPAVPDANVVIHLHKPTLAGFVFDSLEVIAALPTRTSARVSVNAIGRREDLVVDASVALPVAAGDPIGIRLNSLWVRRDNAVLSAARGARISIGKGSISLSRLDVSAEERGKTGRGVLPGRVRVDGRFGPQDQLQAKVVAEGFEIGPWLTPRPEVASKEALTVVLKPVDEKVDEIVVAGLPRVYAGRVDATVVVKGRLSAPTIDAQVQLADGRVDDLEGLGLSATVATTRSKAEVHVDANWDKQRVKIDGSLPIGVKLDGTLPRIPKNKELPLSFTLKTENVDLAPLAKALRLQEMQGKVTADITLSGTTLKPRGVIQLEAKGFAGFDVLPLDLRVGVDARADEIAASLVIGKRGSNVVTAGITAPSGILDGLIRGKKILALLMATPTTGFLKVAQTDMESLVSPQLLPDIGNPRVEADIKIAGTLPRLEVSGTVGVLSLKLTEEPIDVDLSLGYQTDTTKIDGVVSHSAVPLAMLNGTVPGPLGAWFFGRDLTELLRDKDLLLSLELASAQTVHLKPLVPDLVRRLEGMFKQPQVTAMVKIVGTSGGPQATATASVRAGTEGDADLVFDAVELTAVANPRNSEVDVIIRQSLAAKEGEIAPGFPLFVHAEAEIGTSMLFAGPARPLESAEVSGYIMSEGFDVRLLHRLVPEALGASAGVLYADVSVSGTIGSPIVGGGLRGRFERLIVQPLGLDQPNVDVTLWLSNEKVYVSPLVLMQGDRRLELHFGAELTSLRPSGIKLNGSVIMDRYPILGRHDVSLDLSGRVDIGGTLARPGIKADLTVDKVTVRPETGGRDIRPIGPPIGVAFVGQGSPKKEVKVNAADKAEQVAGAFDLDVKVHIPRRAARVRNDQLDVWAEGDLRVRTEGKNIVLLGRITVDEGEVDVYGREFTLEPESAVIFDGGEGIDPILDIRARFSLAEIDLAALGTSAGRDDHILLTVSGRATKPKIDLRGVLESGTDITQKDILAIITVGFPLGGAGGDYTSAAGNMLMGLVSSSASRILQDRLPVDVFKLEADSGDLAGARITVGKRLMRDLVLSYNADFGAQEGENKNEVSLMYEITKRIQLDTRYGDAGEGGADLLLRWRF